MSRFKHRRQAGRLLAEELRAYAEPGALVLALPRGGVPVGYEVARALDLELDIWVVRKIGVPWHPEVGVGAVAEGGYTYLNREVLQHVQLLESDLSQVIEAEHAEVAARVEALRRGRPRPKLHGRTLIVVDDGVATGGTVRAAIRSMRAQAPRAIVVATPVASANVVRTLRQESDDVVSLCTPPELYAVGVWYEDFAQVPDDEVARLLRLARDERASASQQPATELVR